MTDLKFNEYWLVFLKRNPEYNKNENPEEHEVLMKLHFEFIKEQAQNGNMFVAIPLDAGGLYFFDGSLEKETMEALLEEEGSIQGGVFVPDLRRAHIPEHHVVFTLESMKRIQQFQEQMVQGS